MSDEEIIELSKYCSGVYYRDYNQWLFSGMTYEDFKQTFILLALENPTYSPALLMRLFRYKRLCATDAVHYKVENMTKFSDLLISGFETEEDIIETFGEKIEDDFFNYKKSSIFGLSKMLYPNEKSRQKFLDYMHGQSLGGSWQRNCRIQLFKKRFEILDYLFLYGKISMAEKKRLTEFAQTMTRYAPVKRTLSQSSSAVANRKAYEKKKLAM